MEFEFQITVEDYAAGQWLYVKARMRSQYALRISAIYLLGLLAFAAGWIDHFATVSANLLLFFGCGFLLLAIYNSMPKYRFRRSYKNQFFEGYRFYATINEEYVQVNSKFSSTLLKWQAIAFWAEDADTFLLLTNSRTVFIFGKLYLGNQEQSQLRQILQTIKRDQAQNV